MRTSKPFAFVLWVDGADFAYTAREWFTTLPGFAWCHMIRHEPEQEPAPLISRVKAQPAKPHWHCLVWSRQPTDYPSQLVPHVERVARKYPQYGEKPISWQRSHDGKCNNVSAWLAYVIHDPRYMAYLEKIKERPETHKTSYKWDDIVSTDDEQLNEQCLTAAAWIDKTVKNSEQFTNAITAGATSPKLLPILLNCSSYAQMLAARATFMAARYDETTPPPLS